MAAFALLAWWEVRVERCGKDPLLKPSLLAQPSFSAGAIFAIVYFAGFTSVFFTSSWPCRGKSPTASRSQHPHPGPGRGQAPACCCPPLEEELIKEGTDRPDQRERRRANSARH